MQQSIKTRETKHKQNVYYTVTSLKTKKKHFTTFVITQLEFGQAPSIVVRPQASIIQADTICPQQNQFHFMRTFNKTSYKAVKRCLCLCNGKSSQTGHNRSVQNDDIGLLTTWSLRPSPRGSAGVSSKSVAFLYDHIESLYHQVRSKRRRRMRVETL